MTKTELGTLALQMMRVVEGDATPDANDTTLIETAYDQVYQMLLSRHLVSWTPSGDIPDACATPVAYLVAKSRLSLFEVPQDAQALILTGAQSALGDITEVLALDYVGVSIPSEPL